MSQHRPEAPQGAWARFRSENMDLIRLGGMAVLIFAVMAALRPSLFLSSNNFVSMGFQFPEFAILTLAMMISMLTGGIDLSIIGNMNLSAILAGMVLASMTADPTNPVGLPIALAVVIALAVGTAGGLVNGLLVAHVGIPPILATLGTSQVFLGLAIVLTGGASVHGFPTAFSFIGNGKILGLPVPVLVFAALAIVVAVVLNKSAFGAKVYLLGANPLASRFAGLKNSGLLIGAYTLAGFLSGAAGILIMSRTNSIRADFGASYLLLTILVAVLGGVNPYGGFGKVFGVILAVLALQFLSSGFNMLRFSNFAREFIWGALLLVVMVMGTIRFPWRKRQVKKRDSSGLG
ncbi:MAG: ABC transporter permease [Trueperaceae bacterium]